MKTSIQDQQKFLKTPAFLKKAFYYWNFVIHTSVLDRYFLQLDISDFFWETVLKLTQANFFLCRLVCNHVL